MSDFPEPGIGMEKSAEERMEARKVDCFDCARYYPGVGCNSEAEMACGCCFSKIEPSERIEQLLKIMTHSVYVMTHVMKQVKKKEDEENDVENK